MSFDILLVRLSEQADDGAVWGLLEASWDAPPDEHTYARVRRGIGEAELYAEPLGEPLRSLMFSRPKGGHEIFDLIVEVARAGRMAIMPVGCPPCVATNEDLENVPDDMAQALGRPIVVTGGRQLLDVIETS